MHRNLVLPCCIALLAAACTDQPEGTLLPSATPSLSAGFQSNRDPAELA
jgi:hypothetical protein